MVVETPSASGGTTVVTVRRYHEVKIDGYSRSLNSHGARPAFSSSPFRAGGHTWHVSYRPMGSPHHPENTEFVSLYLVLDDIVDEAVMAEVTFSLLRQDGTPAESRTTRVHDFSVSRERAFGYEDFIAREELERSEYLKDDCFSIRVHVHMVKQARSYVTVPPSDLHRHLGDLLSSKEDADVEFEVGGETFAAHRVVLAARSPVFMAELLGPMKVAANVRLRVHDMEPQVFDALLVFMYTDTWPEMEDEDESAMAQHLLVAADRYGLQRLKLMCEDKLCSRISSTDSAATILALAEQHCCPRLKDACFQLLASSTAVTESKELEFLAQSCPAVAEELLAHILEKTTIRQEDSEVIKGKGKKLAAGSCNFGAPGERAVLKWSRPPVGRIKINVDAAFFPITGQAGVGVVARDSQGMVTLASCRVLRHCTDAEEAKLLACKEGLSLALQWIAEPVSLETDCLSVCNMLKCKTMHRPRLAMLVRKVLQLLGELRGVEISHCNRSQNRVSHLLTKRACTESLCKVWLRSAPDFVVTALATDCTISVT